MRRVAKVKELVIGSLVSLVIFLLLAEVSARIYTHFFITYDVEMTRYANELKISADNPRIGHLHRPNKTAHLMGVDITTNSAGFRDDEYTIERNSKRRILFLGDSLTLGWGVEKERTFEALLEKELSKKVPVEIINFGHGNYNTDQEVNLLKDRGLEYKPDQVVLFYFINDAEPTPVKSRMSFLGYSRFVTLFWSRLKALSARAGGPASFDRYYSELYANSAPGWIALQKALQKYKELCSEHKIICQIVILPELHVLAQYPFEKEQKKVIEVIQKNGISYLDLTSSFRSVRDAKSLWVASDDAHPNAMAHKMIANLTYDFILKGN